VRSWAEFAGEVKTLSPQRGFAAILGGVWLAAAAARGVGERIFIAASTSETRNLQQSLAWLCLPQRTSPTHRIHLHLHHARVQSGDRQAHTSPFREREQKPRRSSSHSTTLRGLVTAGGDFFNRQPTTPSYLVSPKHLHHHLTSTPPDTYAGYRSRHPGFQSIVGTIPRRKSSFIPLSARPP
jgi:hypothetical protein